MGNDWKSFLAAPPLTIIDWQDDLSPAKGWLVINSLRGGAAGGGTRMHKDCTKEEIVELAKTMEVKFTVSGPPIGGAKAGIAYDFKGEADKQAVLARWFHFIKNHLAEHYGTGGDQNIDQLRDAFPLLFSLGIQHPQEGIVRGYHRHLPRGVQDSIIQNLQSGTGLLLEQDTFLRSLSATIADMATGYGVVEAMRIFLGHLPDRLTGKKIIIEGFGQVGRAVAYYAYFAGARIVGIIDQNWYIFDEHGLTIPELLQNYHSQCFFSDHNTAIQQYTGHLQALPKADIFIPAATSHTIDTARLANIKQAGVTLIVCAANNPFSSEAVAMEADEQFSVIPDFIANAGMARVYSYLMRPEVVVQEKLILNDIASCIGQTVAELVASGDSFTNLFKRARVQAVGQLLN